MKVNFTLEQATKAQRGSRGITALALTSELDVLGGAQGRYGELQEILPATGI